jgi:rubrerythrin
MHLTVREADFGKMETPPADSCAANANPTRRMPMTDKTGAPDLKAALLDPTAVFEAPAPVAACEALSRAARIEVLCRWEYDARELDVEEDESIVGHDADSLLGAVHRALHALGAQLDLDEAPPTRQGGLTRAAVAASDGDGPAQVDAPTLAAMAAALDDEYKARATYRAVLAAFGAVQPFSNIVEAEQRHAEALLALYERFGETPPTDRWAGRVGAPASLAEACAAAIAAELDNAAMFDRLLGTVDHPVVLTVLRNLQEASCERHLPAFRRCLAREAGGGGLGAGGRRRRHRRRGGA